MRHLLTDTTYGADTVNAIIDLAKSGDAELITTGPLTNVALALIKDRPAMQKLKHIYMLAGMVFHGDAGPMTETNFLKDPKAADLVLRSGIPITLIPIDVGSYEERLCYALHPELITKSIDSYTRIDTNGEYTYGANINDVRNRDRKEFVAQGTKLHPFNCTIVLDNIPEEISMEV